MSRKLCITAIDGQTGHLIAELLLTNQQFSKRVDAVVGFALDPTSPHCDALKNLGAEIEHHVPGTEREIVSLLKESGADTICIIPPAHTNKYEITLELVTAAKKAGIQNVCLLSSAGADMAEARKQPRLREFIEIENLVLSTKGDPSTPTGHSPVVIRYVSVHLVEDSLIQKLITDDWLSTKCGLLHGELTCVWPSSQRRYDTAVADW
jgi:hypothetical protein